MLGGPELSASTATHVIANGCATIQTVPHNTNVVALGLPAAAASQLRLLWFFFRPRSTRLPGMPNPAVNADAPRLGFARLSRAGYLSR
jgi:hypothetical protein